MSRRWRKVLNKSDLVRIINSYPRLNILVVGDLIMDHYLWCHVDRISPEAPVPIAKFDQETFSLGGAANVASNLRSLGVNTYLCGYSGDDYYGQNLQTLLKEIRIDPDLILTGSHPTILKSRVMAANQQLIRIDYEKQLDLKNSQANWIMHKISSILPQVNLIILSDYAKGLLSPPLVKKIISAAHSKKVPVYVDPYPENYLKFKGADLIKPNRKEAEIISGIKFKNDLSNLEKVASRIKKRLKTQLVITLGKDGMAITDPHFEIIPTTSREVYNVSGAGDTVMATLGASLAAGADLRTATLLANLAGGVVVEKIGTSTCSAQELKKRLRVKL